jgi:DNA-binding NarL/FixJ family response regulator
MMGNRREVFGPVCNFNLFPLTPQEWDYASRALMLTRQQTRIVEQLLHGRQDKQIADELRLSRATVRTHLTRLFARLGVLDRLQLVLRVLACVREWHNDGDTMKPFESMAIPQPESVPEAIGSGVD